MSGPAMLLQQAADHASFAAADGWPGALTPGKLAALQYPHDDTPDGKERAQVQQRRFSNLAANAIKAGELAAETVQRKESISARMLKARLCRSASGVSRDIEPEMVDVQVVRPAAVAAWLDRISEQPSRLVAAWLLAKGAAPAKVVAGETAKAVTLPLPSKSTGGKPAAREEIEAAFPIAGGWGDKLKKASSGRYAWLDGTWIRKGTRRPGDATTYNPAAIAAALVATKRMTFAACDAALIKNFSTWIQEWENKGDYLKN